MSAACSQKSDTYRQLETIDSLLLGNNKVDTAVVLLRDIEPKTREDTAYYNILLSAAEYDQDWKIKSLDPLNYSINYYTTHPDNLKLANAYYYKALYFIALEQYTEEVVLLLKKAEQLAESINNIRLINRIYATLSIVNVTRGELEESLKYSDKECITAKKMHDDYCLAYALMSRSILYKTMNHRDSSEYYILQCKTIADNIESDDRALLYNYLGECFKYDNPAAAKKYFFDALKYSKLPDVYANLAQVYYNEGQYEIAEKYCDSALVKARITVRKEVLELMAEKSYESKNLEKHKKASEELIKTLKWEMQSNEQSRVLELQKKYDFEKQRAKYERKQWILYTAIGLLIVLCLLGLVLHKLRLQKIRNHDLELESANALLYSEITDLNNKITTCKSHIANLQTGNQQMLGKNCNTDSAISTNDEKINQLNTRLKDLSNRQLGYFEKGAQIFKLIELNLPITKYNSDWADCVYYFNTKYPEHEQLFDEYNSLTINDKIFIIADVFLNKSDDEIAKILAVSPVTIRTRRSKIKKKMNNNL